MNRTPQTPMVLTGLAIALFAMPLTIGVFTALQIPWTTSNVLLREMILFGFATALAYIIRRKERLGWDSVGLKRPPVANTALWTAVTMLGVAVVLVAALGIIKLFHLPMGSADSSKFDALPIWLIVLVIVRAGFIEEFLYRGYAIERLQILTGNRLLSASVPLVLFAIFHYRQGWAGIIIALLVGAVLTAVYLYKRNLWINITTHFLVDFIPNILLPLFLPR